MDNPSPSLLPPLPRLKISKGGVTPVMEQPQAGPSAPREPQPGPSRVPAAAATAAAPKATAAAAAAAAVAAGNNRRGKSMEALEVLLKPLEASEDEEIEDDDESVLGGLSQISAYDENDERGLAEGCASVLRTIEVCKRRNVAIKRELVTWNEYTEHHRQHVNLGIARVNKLKRERQFNYDVTRILTMKRRRT